MDSNSNLENNLPANSLFIFTKKVLKWLAKAWIGVTSFIGTLVVAIIILIMIAIGAASEYESNSFSNNVIHEGGEEVVAVVDLTGTIIETIDGHDGLAFETGIISSRRVASTLKTLAEDDAVKAVVLRINSPGGGVVASDNLYQAIKDLNDQKPVVSSFGEVAASGGYYLAVGSSSIIANPSTITGSIGVIAQFPEVSGLLDKVGIELRTFKTGQFKDIGAVDRPISVQEREIIDSIITQSYDQFVEAIVEGRDIEKARVRQIADGRIYTGKQAMELGLIDGLGNFEAAISQASQLADLDNPSVIKYSTGGFLEALFESKASLNPLRALAPSPLSDGFGVYYLLSL